MARTRTLPAEFADLEGFVADWDLATEGERLRAPRERGVVALGQDGPRRLAVHTPHELGAEVAGRRIPAVGERVVQVRVIVPDRDLKLLPPGSARVRFAATPARCSLPATTRSLIA